MITDEQIKGMLIVLNKIYWKYEDPRYDMMLAEANDIPGLKGHFIFTGEQIVYVRK